ncbi:type II toxin-antitoxin system Phd/YefM family antitoxin [Arthrobacter dokdonensis]|uniref:type II toxin-antitoxin system Phd/YefM family antitoxin n=1 Tax=Arthrobacter dokdonellae TaxID=2211210 RepID=UPI000DE5ACCD|nr:type II toxin-antitoxin system prevent-host-death family antitoxin [Arthrobacter dokdonellae]
MGVGIRDFKAHLSLHLARVRSGETIIITDRGTPVAQVVPLRGDETLQRLVADGKVTSAAKPKHPSGDPLDVGAPVSDLVAEQRG